MNADTKNKASSNLFLLGGILLIIGGVWFLYEGLMVAPERLKLAIASSNWPATEGIIGDSYTREIGDELGTKKWYVSYKYSVNGITYWGDEFDFREASIDQDTIDQYYSVGKKVQVYYDPDNPMLAVLVPGPSSSTYSSGPITTMMGVACIGVAIFLLSRA